jgi:hypothetical protein
MDVYYTNGYSRKDKRMVGVMKHLSGVFGVE